MNRTKSVVTYLCLFSFLLSQQVLACTGVLVGKGASVGGSLIISRNEDFSVNNWAKHMVVRPAAENKKGDKWEFDSGLTVPKPAKTLQYTAMPDWDAANVGSGAGPYEEVGINSANVAVTATFSADGNEKSKKADPFVKVGIEESVIPTLLLSQATSARQAVELLGGYVETIGATEADGLAISDPKEIWLMEIGSGHHWIAVKIPDDKYMVAANALRVHDVDLDDPEVLHSKGILEHVKKNKLLKDVDSKRFDFAGAFGVLGVPYDTDRIWLAQHILSPSVKQKTRAERYPLFMTPDKKIGVLEIASVLRADYQGTPLEGKAKRKIGVDRNVESHIIEMRPNKPAEIQGVIWQSIGNVDDSIFIPWYGSITKTPKAYREGTDQFDEGSAYWAYRSIGALLNYRDGLYRPTVRKMRDKAEERLVDSLSYVDNAIAQMLAKDKDLGLWFVNMHSNGFALQALERAHEIRSNLIKEITKSTEKKYSKEEWEKISEL